MILTSTPFRNFYMNILISIENACTIKNLDFMFFFTCLQRNRMKPLYIA